MVSDLPDPLPALDRLLAPLADPERLPWLVAGFALAVAALALFAWWRGRRRVGRANLRRLRAAQRAETAAERLLERLGFAVVERQVTRRWTLSVDGEETEVWCRADLVLARRGRLYVADVKSGERSPDPFCPATRRQLLEYLLAFGADAALVVDMELGRVYEVSFPGLLGER